MREHPFKDTPLGSLFLLSRMVESTKSGNAEGALTEHLEEAQGFSTRLVSQGWDQTFANDRVSIRST